MKTFIRLIALFPITAGAIHAALPEKAAHSAVPDKSAIIALENATWRSVQQKKMVQFKQLVSESMRAINADAMMTMPDELKAIPKAAIKTVSLTDFKVTFHDEKIAVVAYVAKVETVANGKDEFTTYNAGSVWQLSKGQWQAIFRGEARQASAK